MKKLFTCFALSLICSNALLAQNSLVGHWQGTANVGRTLRLVFNIAEKDGKLTGTLDSPDQGATNLPGTAITRTGDSVLFDFSNIGIQYAGKIITADSIDGSWHQAGHDIPFGIRKTDKPAELNRPQTPKPPFNYKSEDVSYTNKDKSITFAGTITIPNGKGPFPAVLLVTGSGPQNRDEELFGHKPFAVIADYLTKHGYIVLRVDDRGTGKTTGTFKGATTADFVQDANAGIDFLESRKEVNDKKVGLLGHSEGAIIAPTVASQRKDIDFVIMMAGPGVPLTMGMQLQNIALAEKQGMVKELANQYGVLYLAAANAVTEAKDSVTAKTKITKAVQNWQINATPEVLEKLDMKGPQATQDAVEGYMDMYRDPWFRYFIALNPADYLEKLSCKVLAINGDKDLQVVSKPNLDGIRQSLSKSKTTRYDVQELPGLNHLFQTCNRCTITEYGILEETIAPTVLQTIQEWMDKNVK